MRSSGNGAGRRSSSLAKEKLCERCEDCQGACGSSFGVTVADFEAVTGKLLAKRNFKGQPSMRSPGA